MATQQILGYDTVRSQYYNMDNYVLAFKVTLPMAARIVSLSSYDVNVSGYTASCGMGIYADNGSDYPGSLLYGTGGRNPANDWQWWTVSGLNVVARAGTYWLALCCNDFAGTISRRYDYGLTVSKKASGSYSTPPATFPIRNVDTSTLGFSMYAVYYPLFDLALWSLWPGPKIGSGQYWMLEGITQTEQGLSPSEVVSLTLSSLQTIVTYRLPMPALNVLKAGTYVVAVRAKANTTIGSPKIRALLEVDGTTSFASSETSITTTEATYFLTISVASDTSISQQLLLKIQGNASASLTIYVYPWHGDVQFGVDGQSSGGVPRSTLGLAAIAPSPGTHAAPVLISTATPSFNVQATAVYPDDTLTLRKYSDTRFDSTHNATSPVSQSLGAAKDITSSFPALGVRAFQFSAASSQKAVPIYNTYYVLEVASATGALLGSAAWELLLNVKAPSLLTLAGATSSTPAITEDLEPWVEWSDPNTDTTHWRVRVYRATDDALMWDSGETPAGATKCQIPATADLLSLTTYYVVVALMSGSGGSNWSIDSARGYFQIDKTATGAKITSHEGTSDAPAIETSTTPTFEWYFSKPQQAFNLEIRDETAGRVAYRSGWIASSDTSHAVPSGSALTLGHTYSVQVQIKDAVQAHVFTCDKRAWLHINEYPLPAPTLTAEPDTDSHTQVLLEWQAPAVNDGDALTYELEVTRSYGGSTYPARTYNAETTSFLLGYLSSGTYSWRVRAIDEHGLESAWSSADTFDVALASTPPEVTLQPWGPSTNPLVSTWSVYDEEGDPQDAYQIQLALDEGFEQIVQDSGAVASTNLYHQHPDLSPGTYWRRLKVRTAGVDWSAWTVDTVTVVSPTTQQDELQIILDPEGEATNLDLAAHPVSGVSLVRRLDGPAVLRFTVDNFDGTEAGIEDAAELLVRMRDRDGGRIEFRGAVTSKRVGDLVEIEAQDISRLFDHLRVTRWLYRRTIGEIIAAIVENPSGSFPTGITAHCDEVVDSATPGAPITATLFVGGGRTVAEWLSEFQKSTGYRWWIETQNGEQHFYWRNPDALPTFPAVLRDDIDRAAESPTQWRVGDGVQVDVVPPQANRVRFQAVLTPPLPPWGFRDFDAYFTESAARWTAWNNYTTITEDADAQAGTKSIKFTYEFTPSAQITWPTALPLGYFALPLDLQDQSGMEWGAWRFKAKMRLSIGGVVKSEGDLPQSGLLLYYCCSEAAKQSPCVAIGPDGSTAVGAALPGGTKPPWSNWMSGTFSPLRVYGNQEVRAGVKHVLAIGIGYQYWGGAPSREQLVPPPTVPAGQQIKIEVWLDDLAITSVQWDPLKMVDGTETPPVVEMTVETPEVTAGEVMPIEVPLQVSGLSRSEAMRIAQLKLAELSKTRRTVSELTLDGIRYIPLDTLVQVLLAGRGLTAALPLVQVEYKLWEAGDCTVLTLGDVPVDEQRSLENLRALLQKIQAELGLQD